MNRRIKNTPKTKSKRVITYGTYDLLHIGHINLLKRAKALGDYLVVALSTDEFNLGKHKTALLGYEQRKAILESIKYVDEVIPEENWKQKIEDVKKHNIDIFVMGDDWKGEFDFLKKYCEVIYLERTKNISTSLSKEKLGVKEIQDSKTKLKKNSRAEMLIVPGKNLKQSITRAIIHLLMLFFYPLLFFIPRKKEIWIFGSNHGKKFADNSKYLYLYTIKNYPKIRAIWMTTNKKLLKKFSEKNYEAYHSWSVKGLWYSLRAKYAISSYGLHDFNKILLGGIKNIQLWHGTPLKNISPEKRDIRTKVRMISGNKYHNYIAPSKEVKNKFKRVFMNDGQNINITGYPRNDALFNTSWFFPEENFVDNLKKSIKFKHVITYLPTWRGEGDCINLFKDYKFDLDEIQKKLKKLNAILIIKAHHMNKQIIPEGDLRDSRIFSLSDEEFQDIYPILKETDILITDYSSIYFDFLLLNRPIIFAPFDIKNKQKKFFFYDYDTVTPGPKAKNWIEVFDCIEKEVKSDGYKKERKKMLEMFNEFKDNQNSKRVFELIKNL